MSAFSRLFSSSYSNIIGMVHTRALPGTPKSLLPVSKIVEIALEEAAIYADSRVDSILIENMHDIPYIKSVGPEIVSTMTSVAWAVRDKIPTYIPIGIQILAGANEEALAVANAAGLQYIRAESYVFGHVADEGLMADACAGPLLRYRKKIGAENIAIFSDVKKKHSSHAITSDLSLSETVKAAKFFLADGVILTGRETGDQVKEEEFLKIKNDCPDVPVLIGSGVTLDNVHKFISANAFIIGSHFKKENNWEMDLDKKKIKDFVSTVNKLKDAVI